MKVSQQFTYLKRTAIGVNMLAVLSISLGHSNGLFLLLGTIMFWGLFLATALEELIQEKRKE
ncbi:hypothetical protein [Shewanella pealeana]|uniref:hypothetical protein n=1 Tax=Shewanella pealeana TaxID=70864 RepID=UPI0003004E28|nr:hypothetical protein [Shewanella pealeana]